VRLLPDIQKFSDLPVSIHAPVKGATTSLSTQTHPLACFNPRTREGCDAQPAGKYATQGSFNPRTREGCDKNEDREPYAPRPVSIHAPVKGATLSGLRSLKRRSCFNPRTREGCDKTIIPPLLVPPSFNPRTREGCDAIQLGLCGFVILSFNPRTREGCDYSRELGLTPAGLFQSTHP